MFEIIFPFELQALKTSKSASNPRALNRRENNFFLSSSNSLTIILLFLISPAHLFSVGGRCLWLVAEAPDMDHE